MCLVEPQKSDHATGDPHAGDRVWKCTTILTVCAVITMPTSTISILNNYQNSSSIVHLTRKHGTYIMDMSIHGTNWEQCIMFGRKTSTCRLSSTIETTCTHTLRKTLDLPMCLVILLTLFATSYSELVSS